ncbi:Toxin zeta [Cytospora mali]|uniref:Toxin zeta n=1 Tax=Cytospora mali TaxID=578113 RepID=A0A194VFI1_CYTMA|nr:Toxin zeta [Valsa mali var. pyri (nom. inval.)]
MDTITKDFAPVSVDPKGHVLPHSVNQKIFDETIIQAELSHLKDAGHIEDGVQPIAIFITGQTGAGKAELSPDLWDAIKSRLPAHFVADSYNTYHPEYTSIVNSAPSRVSSATGTDARKWLSMACNWCIDRKIDILLESACRNLEEFMSLISTFHAAGYQVHVAIMAVPECLSLLGIMVRYYKRYSEAQPGDPPPRSTSRTVHYETYDGLLAVADFIDKSSVADDVIVVRRNSLVSYQNYRSTDGLWIRPAAALTSLDLERTRPLPQAEHASFFVDYQWVEEKAGKDDVAAAMLENIEASLAALNSTGGRMSSSFPALKPLDVKQWLFGK